MNSQRRIYLDNAATSWPKPDVVWQAMEDYARNVGASAGRSAHAQAATADRILTCARVAVAQLIDAEQPSDVVFTGSGTDGLNTAIHGVLRPGDHVVTTAAEHNSVLRPLAVWKQRSVDVTYLPVDEHGLWQTSDVIQAIRPNTRLVAVIHASNVTGGVQPVAELGDDLANQPLLLLIDAAQTIGHIPLSVREIGADLLAAPAHKGLLAPQGMGILYVNPDVLEQVHSLRQGGTGTISDEEVQPETMPSKFEAGTHNMIGLAGLLAACEYLLQNNRLEQIRASEAALTRRLLEGLAAIDDIEVHGPTAEQSRVGVVSISVEGYDCQDVSGMLDTAARTQTRAGLHCAPRMHKSLGTFSQGGTVRLSIGHANSKQDIDDTLEALQQIASARP